VSRIRTGLTSLEDPAFVERGPESSRESRGFAAPLETLDITRCNLDRCCAPERANQQDQPFRRRNALNDTLDPLQGPSRDPSRNTRFEKSGRREPAPRFDRAADLSQLVDELCLITDGDHVRDPTGPPSDRTHITPAPDEHIPRKQGHVDPALARSMRSQLAKNRQIARDASGEEIADQGFFLTALGVRDHPAIVRTGGPFKRIAPRLTLDLGGSPPDLRCVVQS